MHRTETGLRQRQPYIFILWGWEGQNVGDTVTYIIEYDWSSQKQSEHSKLFPEGRGYATRLVVSEIYHSIAEYIRIYVSISVRSMDK